MARLGKTAPSPLDPRPPASAEYGTRTADKLGVQKAGSGMQHKNRSIMTASFSTITFFKLVVPLVMIVVSNAAVNSCDFPTLHVSAANGPMRTFVDASAEMKESGAKFVLVLLEDVAKVDDIELLKLVKLEVTEILERAGFAKGQFAFAECARMCTPP